MVTPVLYALEIPLRAYQLLSDYWDEVTERRYHEFGGPLATTFLISLAAPMLNIRYERIHRPNASKNEQKIDRRFVRDFASVMRLDQLQQTPFYNHRQWRYTYVPGQASVSIVRLPKQVLAALSEDKGIDDASVWRPRDWYDCLRHSLAHSTLAYLDCDGLQTAGMPTEMIIFVSRDIGKDNTVVGHHVARITRDGFRDFFDRWIRWLNR